MEIRGDPETEAGTGNPDNTAKESSVSQGLAGLQSPPPGPLEEDGPNHRKSRMVCIRMCLLNGSW